MLGMLKKFAVFIVTPLLAISRQLSAIGASSK
jgi:hypothetical protein